MLAVAVNQALEEMNKQRVNLLNEAPMTPIEFDAFCGGFIAGMTMLDVEDEITPEIVEQAMDIVINMPFAKSIGITGTDKHVTCAVVLGKD